MHLKSLLPLALASAAAAQTMTLAEALAANNSTLSTLNSLLAEQPALVKALEGATQITILAPSNDAFTKFTANTAQKAETTQPDVVKALLSYHVLNGTFASATFTNQSQFIPTLLTNSTYTNVTGGQVVDGVKSSDGKSVNIITGLKEKSTVTTADIMFTGGVMHIVDTVLTIPDTPSVSAIDSQLTALAGGLTKVNLVSAVDSLRDVTIFAPSNDAFKAIGGTAATLTTQQLSSILEYHVINGTVGYSNLLTTGLANETFPTLAGDALQITVEDNKVFVNSAQVTISDIIVGNGVMHVIDNVLNPANATATPTEPTATSQPIAFAAASSASTVPFTSGIVPTTTAPAASTSTAGAMATGYAQGDMFVLLSGLGVVGAAVVAGAM